MYYSVIIPSQPLYTLPSRGPKLRRLNNFNYANFLIKIPLNFFY